MPFATYSIKENSFDKLNKENIKTFKNFINSINELNRKKRAILINKKNNILEILSKKLDEIENPKIVDKKPTKFELAHSKKYGQSIEAIKSQGFSYNSNDSLLEKEFLLECHDCFNSSLKYSISNDKFNVDFEKNDSNNFEVELLNKYSKDIIYAKEFENVIDFENNFLKKLEIFIKVSVQKEKKTKGFIKKIDSINIFHKELSKYLVPNFSKDINVKKLQTNEFLQNDIISHRKNVSYDKTYLINTKKIEAGTKLLLNWWSNLPDEFKPKKFNIITDIPYQVKFAHYSIQNKYLKKIKDFLLKDLKSSSKKPDIIFLNKDELKTKTGSRPEDLIEFWDWTHKKHFAFGGDLPLLINSEFGVEFIDPNFEEFDDKNKENLTLRKNNKFLLVDPIKDTDFEQIKRLYSEFPKKCGI
jgi:hypothetical protein